jgi:type I restriction enzyme M protein
VEVGRDLRANSNLASYGYFMPILGLIFLRQATNRYHQALAAIKADEAAGEMPDRPLVEADFTRRRALMLPKGARYDELMALEKGADLGAALTAAMEAIEQHFPQLSNQLPKDYGRFDNEGLEGMMRTFDTEALRKAEGDVFGRMARRHDAHLRHRGAAQG